MIEEASRDNDKHAIIDESEFKEVLNRATNSS